MKKIPLIILFCLLFILLTACTPNQAEETNEVPATTEAAPAAETTEPPAEPTNPPPSPTPEPSPTVTLAPTATPRTIIWSDDFTDVNSGWERYQEFDGTLDYVEELELYQMHVIPDDSLWWVSHQQNLPDLSMTVSASLVEGPQDSYYGLMCRYNPETFNGIIFAVSADGKAAIGSIANEGPFPEADWTAFDAVQTGRDNINLISVNCIGDELSMSVNDTLLFSIPAPDIQGDDIGLIVGNPVGDGGAKVYFDDLVIYEP